MNCVARALRQTKFWKRLPVYRNPMYITTRSFSVQSRVFSSSHQVPSTQEVKRIIAGHKIATAKQTDLVKEAASKMIEARIGCLVVVDDKDDHEMVGVVTERDCMRAIASKPSLNDVILRDIMTANQAIITAKNSISSDDCFRIMLSNNIRHLPLVDEDFVVCRVLSIKDVAASMISENDRRIHEKEQEAEYWAWRAINLDESTGSYMSH
jgi:CBS domain-containing protein